MERIVDVAKIKARLFSEPSSLSDFRRKSFVFNNGTFSAKKLSAYFSIAYTNQTTQVRQTPRVRRRILADFGVTGELCNAEEFTVAVIGKLEQEPVASPLECEVDDNRVFRAAVRAVGSNSRSWATFLKFESRLSEMLCGYDPRLVRSTFNNGTLTLDRLRECLPGQSSSADSRAIKGWADLLGKAPEFYRHFCALGIGYREMGRAILKRTLTDSELMLCLVGHLADPPGRWRGQALLTDPIVRQFARRKLPGMQYILASEFLRNLGWSGFKPDRHVRRLFDLWSSRENPRLSAKARELAQLIGRRNTPLLEYLYYSFLRMAASPPGLPYSQVDNLVWLLGAYSEKKGKESSEGYLSVR